MNPRSYPYEQFTEEVLRLLEKGCGHDAIYKYIANKTGKTYNAVKKAIWRRGFDNVFRNSQTANSASWVNPTSSKMEQNEPIKTTNGSHFARLKTELGLHNNEFGLPEPLDDEIKVHKLPTSCSRILLLSDLHLPFHSIDALTAALKYGVEHKANTIYINGDGIDFYGISRFEKEKRLRNLKEEIEQFREFVGIIDKLFPLAYKVYKLGNHCARWSSYIRQNAKEFEDIDDFAFGNVMRLNQSGWHLIEDRDFGKAGKLHILHGHELMQATSPVNPARGVFMKAMQSVIVGHHHRTSEHSGKNIGGDFITTWSTGCLSQLRPKYNPLSSYNHGFAFIEVEPDGDFRVHNKRIDNGKIY
jgi:predicted phosphodiesterase